MRNFISKTRLLSGLLALLALVGCKDTTGPGQHAVGVVTVFAPQSELTIGGSVQLVATVLNETGVSMSNQQVTWATSNPGVATVSPSGLVMALGGGEAEITASAGGRSGSVSIRVQAARCTAAGAGGAIAPGETRNGELTASDCLFLHDINAQGWRFDLTARTTLLIEVSSSQFQPLIVVTDRQLNVLAWTDGNAATAVQLMGTFAAGSYIVWTSSWDQRPRGAYRLSLEVATVASCDAPSGAISVGQTVSGALSAGDCIMESGHLADLWELTLSTGTTLQIDLTSNQFDTFLILTDRDGNWIAADDDGGEGLNSRLIVNLPSGGYLLRTTSYSPGVTGSYQLSVQLPASGGASRESAVGAPAAAATKPAVARRPAAAGSSLESLLARGAQLRAPR